MIDEPWEELRAEAVELPHGAARCALMSQAIEAADAAGDEIAGFSLRLELMWDANLAGDAALSLTAYAWLRARWNADSEPFERFRHQLDWQTKWAPTSAMEHPTIPLKRIEGLIDDVERIHSQAGASPRAALNLRVTLLLHTGDPDGLLPDALAAWRSAPRDHLSDCESCERTEEAETLIAIGGEEAQAEALAVLEPLIDGTVRPCGSGPASSMAAAVPLLALAGRADAARSSLRRGGSGQVADRATNVGAIADLAAAAAATGLSAQAARLSSVVLGGLGELRSPLRELRAVRALSHTLEVLLAEGTDALAVTRVPPTWLASGPGRLDLTRVIPVLQERAIELARAFDERNGTSHQTDLLAIDYPDLPSLVDTSDPLAAVHAAGARGATTSAGASPSPAPQAPLGPAPDDVIGFEAWVWTARERFDQGAIEAAAERLLLDADASAELKAAAVLSAGLVEHRVGLAELDDLSEPLRLRLRSWELRLDEAMTDPARAAALAELAELGARASKLAEDAPDPGPALFALRAVLSATAVVAAVGEDAERALEALASLADEDRFGTDGALDLDRWLRVVATAVELKLRWPDLPSTLPALWVQGSRAALEAHRGSWPGISAALARATGHLLIVLNRPLEAAELLSGHLRWVESAVGIGAREMQFGLGLMLADARHLAGDSPGALSAQRSARLAARTLGHAETAKALRGEARLSNHLGRLDEGIVAAAEAAALLHEAGDPAGSAEMLALQAGMEARVDDWNQAAVTAALALERLPDDPSMLRVRLQALELLAEHADRSWSPDAAERWLAAADVAVKLAICGAGYRSSAARQTNDPDRADELFAEALAEARAAGGDDREWYTALVLQRSAENRQWREPERAVAEAMASAEDFLTSADPARAARSRLIEGQARRRTGDRAGALEALRHGAELAEKTGREDLRRTIVEVIDEVIDEVTTDGPDTGD